MSSIAIGYVHGDLVHAKFMRSVLDENADVILDEESSANISGARNRLVRKFLDSGAEWLYMADTDTVFPVGTVSRLIDSGKQIISGLVMVDSSPPIPMMYRRLADVGFGIGMFSAITEWDEKIIKVDSVGAGCLMVHRDVYIDIESRLSNRAAPWFQESVVGTQLIGEDFTFCMRAASIGYSIFVNTSVFVGHVKTRVLRADSRQ